jgi:hypothetical protein
MTDGSILGMATPHRDFTNIRIIIQSSMTQKSSELDGFIVQLVRDAQLVLASPSNISMIDRDLFYYSVYLGERGGSWLGQINPDNLVRDDYVKMLEVFEMP